MHDVSTGAVPEPRVVPPLLPPAEWDGKMRVAKCWTGERFQAPAQTAPKLGSDLDRLTAFTPICQGTIANPV